MIRDNAQATAVDSVASGLLSSVVVAAVLVPKSVEATMDKLEASYMTKHGRQDTKQIAKTVFQVQQISNGIELVVAAQSYRNSIVD